MVLIILRHGQSIWNKENIFTGWTDVDLSIQGRKEAFSTVKILKKYKFDYLFTSDQLRAIETTNIIKKELNQSLSIKISTKLKERNYGDLSGKNKYELEKIYGTEKIRYWRKSYYGKPPNGENLEEVKHRFGKYYDIEIKPLLDQNKNILIISHHNTLRALFVHLGLKNKDTIEDLDILNCKPIKIDIKDKTFSYL